MAFRLLLGLQPYVEYVKRCTGKTMTTEADLVAHGIREQTVKRLVRNYG